MGERASPAILALCDLRHREVRCLPWTRRQPLARDGDGSLHVMNDASVAW